MSESTCQNIHRCCSSERKKFSTSCRANVSAEANAEDDDDKREAAANAFRSTSGGSDKPPENICRDGGIPTEVEENADVEEDEDEDVK